MLKPNIKHLIDHTKLTIAHLSPSVDRDRPPCLTMVYHMVKPYQKTMVDNNVLP